MSDPRELPTLDALAGSIIRDGALAKLVEARISIEWHPGRHMFLLQSVNPFASPEHAISSGFHATPKTFEATASAIGLGNAISQCHAHWAKHDEVVKRR